MLRKPEIHTPTAGETVVIRLLVVTGVASVVHFALFFFDPAYRGHPLLYGILCFVIGFGLVRNLINWYYYASIRVPDHPVSDRRFTVDVLTTYFPGEPYAMIEETLRAIRAITYPHTTYLCDEADDPYLRKVCDELGVIHVTRDNRHHAKAGNINNALRQATGEICLILDPDHVPQPDFLDYIVPHFSDERIGFVQTVQAYYNKFDTLVARGAAQQTFHFYGPMMMSMQAYGTVNAIGANCTFRRAALDSIGGHAPGLAEDMHTAMLLYREGWKSVYVPRILARGQVPVTLTAYFKQQLKWARGTFDLFVKVYPRIFGRLTWRQRLHYALMPVHYLAGLSYLGVFLVPVLSLLLSETPWRGNFVDFVLYALPLLASAFVIRQYIQRWLMQHDERGFHLVGGVLEIVTWWVFTVGLIYTLFNKRIPYLPTPKGGAEATHIRLLLPNLTVAGVSVVAVGFGLYRDFTPFSLLMAAFALLNALFMLFSVYLGLPVTNRTSYLRQRTPGPVARMARTGKAALIGGLDLMTLSVRTLAPVLLLAVVFLSLRGIDRRGPSPTHHPDRPSAVVTGRAVPEVGFFYPAEAGGSTNFTQLDSLSASLPYPVGVVSSYFNWEEGQLDRLRHFLDSTAARGAVPMITWEPWLAGKTARPPHLLTHIAEGRYDDYIVRYARAMASYGRPVYLRFAHEFTNPDYPWSSVTGNTPADYVRAWRHVHDVFRALGADRVRWVWNPWRAGGAGAYFPGPDYVDYLGITALNYSPAYDGVPDQDFDDIYAPYIPLQESTDLPVLVAEFGSLGHQEEKRNWVMHSLDYIRLRPEIKGVVYFNSTIDKRLPGGGKTPEELLDWSLTAPPDVVPPIPTVAYPCAAGGSPTGRPLPFLRAVHYGKVGRHLRYEYLPTRNVLEEDFAEMQKAGIRQIAITDPGIYRYNLFRISDEYGLGIIYNVWIPDTLDVLNDPTSAGRWADRIVADVSELRTTPNLIAYHFANDLLYAIGRRIDSKSVEQQRAYLEWLGRLLCAVRTIDPDRPILMNIRGDERAKGRLKTSGLDRWPVDGFTVGFPSDWNREDLPSFPDRLADRIVYSGVGGDTFGRLPDSLRSTSMILANWQHDWSPGHLSFDGLLNFRGQRTPAYAAVASTWGVTSSPPITLPYPAILPPAKAPHPGMVADYRALRYGKDAWVPVPPDTELQYDWALIQLSEYGHPTAREQLPEGTTVSFPLPDDHLDYLIELTVTDGFYARSVRRPLLPVR
jgi:cellulose synthase/poly-beta-1,6-N-acetylglucosamine synthase-like glycosyltransferase